MDDRQLVNESDDEMEVSPENNDHALQVESEEFGEDSPAVDSPLSPDAPEKQQLPSDILGDTSAPLESNATLSPPALESNEDSDNSVSASDPQSPSAGSRQETFSPSLEVQIVDDGSIPASKKRKRSRTPMEDGDNTDSASSTQSSQDGSSNQSEEGSRQETSSPSLQEQNVEDDSIPASTKRKSSETPMEDSDRVDSVSSTQSSPVGSPNRPEAGSSQETPGLSLEEQNVEDDPIPASTKRRPETPECDSGESRIASESAVSTLQPSASAGTVNEPPINRKGRKTRTGAPRSKALESSASLRATIHKKRKIMESNFIDSNDGFKTGILSPASDENTKLQSQLNPQAEVVVPDNAEYESMSEREASTPSQHCLNDSASKNENSNPDDSNEYYSLSTEEYEFNADSSIPTDSYLGAFTNPSFINPSDSTTRSPKPNGKSSESRSRQQEARMPMPENRSDQFLQREHSEPSSSGDLNSRQRPEFGVHTKPSNIDVQQESSAGIIFDLSGLIPSDATSDTVDEWNASLAISFFDVKVSAITVFTVIRYLMLLQQEELLFKGLEQLYRYVVKYPCPVNVVELQTKILCYLSERKEMTYSEKSYESFDDYAYDGLLRTAFLVFKCAISVRSCIDFREIMTNYNTFKILYEKCSMHFKKREEDNTQDTESKERMHLIQKLLLETRCVFQMLLMHIGQNAGRAFIDTYAKQILKDDEKFLRTSIE